MLCSAKVHVTGIVQGVGFRPFVYNLAISFNLKGYVLNLGDAGVSIVLEGKKVDIDNFLSSLKIKKPPTAKIYSLKISWGKYTGQYKGFSIKKSSKKMSSGMSSIPPDVGICEDCIRDVLDPNSRWYLYPFTCCAVCGPRFTVICDLPYDRENTSMIDFPLCNECMSEYNTPSNRRFHAQGICCPNCGPQVFLYDINKNYIKTKNPIVEAAKLIDDGYIIGIKGLGGFHIAAKTTDDEVVKRLRIRRARPSQPFAIMSSDLQTIKSYALVSPLEEKLLTSYERPIVLLKKSNDYYLSKLISPGLHTIGVMLPYTALHLLLLKFSHEPALIMTSGNLPQEPMVVKNESAFLKLKGITDFLLIHNRKIVNRCDDSVLRVTSNLSTLIRRSRGFVPVPIKLKISSNKTVLAVGAEEYTTGAILKDDKCYLTQHIGTTNNLDSLQFLKSSLSFFKKLANVNKFDLVACDLHPLFPSTKYAEELSNNIRVPLIKVQHHIAHHASLLADLKIPLEEPSICIVIDGYGYGLDGQAWGGEIISFKDNQFSRISHLEYLPMFGGDLSTNFPSRMLAGFMYKTFGKEYTKKYLSDNLLSSFKYGKNEINIILNQIAKNKNTLYTSSLGRVLDAFSVLLGVCNKRTYEGEPAMKLESFAFRSKEPVPFVFDLPVKIRDGKVILKTTNLLKLVIDLLETKPNLSKATIAKMIHISLGKALANAALSFADALDTKYIGISGGAAVNELLISSIKKFLALNGYYLYRHIQVPPGDGGISSGQSFYSIIQRKS